MSNQAENINLSQGPGNASSKDPKALVMNVIQRAKQIITAPAASWEIIKAEPTTVKDIYQNYLMILAVVPALCGFIAMTVIGISIPFVGTWHAPFFGTLVSQVIQYAVSLVMVYVAALVIEQLAPKFEAKTDKVSAFKLVGYSMTPAWVAGLFALLPGPFMMLAGLAGGIYSIYVFLVGVQPMTSVPSSRKVGYVAVSALIIIVLAIILNFMVALFMPRPDMGMRNPQMLQNEQLKQFEESMKALQKAMPNAPQ
ncbi:MAG: YIP1 family protein [Deltaproteobacteria bacterium]|nr:YIP1 family protein [Deltaproteobacteria bacterium]